MRLSSGARRRHADFFIAHTANPYSITERRVPELILVVGSEPAGDVSHKRGRRTTWVRVSEEVGPTTDHFSVTGRDLFVLAASTDGPHQSQSAVTIRGARPMVSSIRTSSGQRHEDNDNDNEREFIQRVVINKSRTR